MQLKYNAYTQVYEQLQLSRAKVQERTPAFTIVQSASVPVKHSREMAAYVRETAAIIPMLQKMGVTSNLWHQHLLLAMDEGYGRSDFLSGLVRLYSAFGLLKGDVDEKTVREIILCADPEESDGRYRLTWKGADGKERTKVVSLD